MSSLKRRFQIRGEKCGLAVAIVAGEAPTQKPARNFFSHGSEDGAYFKERFILIMWIYDVRPEVWTK